MKTGEEEEAYGGRLTGYMRLIWSADEFCDSCPGMTITKDYSVIALTPTSFCNSTSRRVSLMQLHRLINSVDSDQPCSRAVLHPLVRWLLHLTNYLDCLCNSSHIGRAKGKCFPRHSAALISDSSALSQTPAETAGPRTRRIVYTFSSELTLIHVLLECVSSFAQCHIKCSGWAPNSWPADRELRLSTTMILCHIVLHYKSRQMFLQSLLICDHPA